MKECLQKTFDKSGPDIDGVKIQEKPKGPNYPWAATTRKNKIIIFVPCNKFFGWNEVVLEEYFHVLNQWNTGRMNRRNYIWAGSTCFGSHRFTHGPHCCSGIGPL